MILHVSSPEKFMPAFVRLINEDFGDKKHQFWMSGVQKLKLYPIEKTENVFIVRRSVVSQIFAHIRLLYMLHHAKKVILHGLFNPRVILILALCPWLLGKCYWVIWGGDLYEYQKPKLNLKGKIKERLRKFVIKRIGHLVTYILGDVELARKWYSARGEYHECLMYLSNVVNPQILKGAERAKEAHSGLNILVGNSADPSNNHLDALEKLLPYKDQDISIYVPLSYGDQAHAEKVIEKGRDWFGDKFLPITSFMPFEQYLAFLKSVDIAIFNHKRQQAMGNTITLLGLGKTIYMRSDVSQWELFERLEVKVFDISKFDNACLSIDDIVANKIKVSDFFSLQTLVFQYNEIFLNEKVRFLRPRV